MDYGISQKDREWIAELRVKLEKKLRAECVRCAHIIPNEITDGGSYEDTENVFWWTNGFWSGMLWQMYSATGEELFKETARFTEKRMDRALELFEGLDHDTGFMFLHSAVADYRLTGDKDAYRRGIHAANILAGRFNPLGGYIRAWNPAYDTENGTLGLFIVDCMMNLPLLFWAYGETGDPRFMGIAKAHADKTLELTLRPDGSANHKVVCDPQTGEFISAPAGQGYSVGSSWSRGQSWAIYGMALAAKYTGEQKYLDAAKRTAHYFLACAADTDYLPLADFRAPAEPVVYDTTAGMCAVCGLLEISQQVGEYERRLYVNGTLKLLRAMTDRFCCWDPQKDGVTDHCTRAYNDGRHIHIIYGDYFLTEAILRLSGGSFEIW